MDERVRENIIKMLRRHRQASAEELSRSLNVTKPDIQYHIKGLLADGSVEKFKAAGVSVGPGRPVLVYRLSAREQADNILFLANALLQFVQRLDSKTPMQQLATMFISQPAGGVSLRQRLDDLMTNLNRWGYMARWEARRNAPHLEFRNCPYARLVGDHPELCEMDAAIIDLGLGMKSRQLTRLSSDQTEIQACIFEIKN